MEIVKKIATAVSEHGGRAFFVGGCVRDFLQDKQSGDYDVEVHGILPETLEKILGELAEIKSVGREFGIYPLQSYPVDIALPRREKAVGAGHRDFAVEIDPFMGATEAAKRRDFTINAMMQDVLTGELVDPYDGMSDLKKGVIRHIFSGRFVEDPLRVFRAAQFAARFKFTLAKDTLELCKTMDVSVLAGGRVCDEMQKALLRAEDPSIFFKVLQAMNHLGEYFPELQSLIGVEQNKRHHAEGDVWTHTMMVLQEAAKRRERVKEKLGFMLAALTHDFGKSICTECIDGELHSYNHEREGLPLIERFLSRLTGDKTLTAYVLNMAELHMKPNTLAANASSVKATNKMFDKAIAPFDLIQLAIADSLGKIAPRPYVETEPFLLERLAVYEEMMSRPYVTGKDLIKAGFSQGEYFGELLAYAHKLRLAGTEKTSALKQTLAYARKFEK